MKRRTTAADAIRAHMSRLVTVMDTGQRQFRTDQAHALTYTDHRQGPLTVRMDMDQRMTTDMGHRQ
jgi:hypothetical protein